MTHPCRRPSSNRPTPRSTRPRRGAVTGLSCTVNRVRGGDERVEYLPASDLARSQMRRQKHLPIRSPAPGAEMNNFVLFDFLFCLSGHEHNYDDVRCTEFGLGQGARREHIPKWICDRRAMQPQAKFGATLRAAVLFRPDFVARSSQTPEGYVRRSRLVWPTNSSPRTSS